MALMHPEDLIREALTQPKDAIVYTISKLLADTRPDKHVLETDSHFFRLYDFAYEKQCDLRNKPDTHSQWQHDWHAGEMQRTTKPYNAWLEVKWEGHELEVVSTGYLGMHRREEWHCIVAESREVAGAFFEAVCAWNSQVRGEVLVFDGGCWHKSKELFEDIKVASFDDLVLEGGLKEQIISDLQSFFEVRERYERYRIAWKRGVLFLGPPGNGKTHAIKASINLLQHPCLYVKSFTAQYTTDQHNINLVFRRARELAPCMLIFEDLDSLLTGENRAYFLNEMDGFASNEGILTLATTNHPERLDPAILERPSRFDRKYTFDLPGTEGRLQFMQTFASRLDEELRPSPDGMPKLVEQTEGYSYAYLKELFLSAMMQWIESPGSRTIDELMLAQCETLKQQMAAAPDVEALASFGTDGSGMPDPAAYARAMAMRYRRR
jgi:hypothetical protein